MNELEQLLFLKIAGTLMLLVGSLLFLYRYRFLKHGVVVEGKVVDHERRVESNDGGGIRVGYIPIIRYPTLDGFCLSFKHLFTGGVDFEVGDSVRLVYAKDDPHEVLLLQFSYLFGMPWKLICLGLLQILISYLCPLVWSLPGCLILYVTVHYYGKSKVEQLKTRLKV